MLGGRARDDEGRDRIMATTERTLSASSDADRWLYIEQVLYDRSPFNVRITTLILFAVLIGAYAAAAWIDHVPWVVHQKSGATVDHRAWVAVSLTLIVCCALGLQRYSRLKEQEDATAIGNAVSADLSWSPTFSSSRLRLFTVIGAVVGGGAMLWFQLIGQGATPHTLAVSGWFVFAAILVGMLFFRGVELTGAGARHSREVVRAGLRIDLLRIEQLYPWGRAASRTALIWFTVSAATLLQFVGGRGFDPYTIALVVGCVAMGAWVFVGTLGLIHREIRKAKASELEVLRTEIAALRDVVHTEPTAPAKLQSLLAYETRIADAPEWPFDQTILVRVGASALILTVPWFGQAVAGLMVEHLGQLAP
jgi:hypothetical protein